MERSLISLEHAQEINVRLNAIGMHLSEFSFPNLYLFRHTHQYEIIRTNKSNFFVSGITYDKKRYIMPISPPSKSSTDCHSDIKMMLASKEWDFIFPVPEEWLSCFDEKIYCREYNEDDSDYLYFAEKIKTYPGKKMHKKKNLLNQFNKQHSNILVSPINGAVLEDAKRILSLWQETSPQELYRSDYNQCMEALELRDELKLSGFIVFVNKQAAGFILGEALNNDTFTIHFAKADIAFKGIYQFLFSRFASDFCSDYLYINQEQDMGLEGLRKTKKSYRPDLMAHKYRISLLSH